MGYEIKKIIHGKIIWIGIIFVVAGILYSNVRVLRLNVKFDNYDTVEYAETVYELRDKIVADSLYINSIMDDKYYNRINLSNIRHYGKQLSLLPYENFFMKRLQESYDNMYIPDIFAMLTLAVAAVCLIISEKSKETFLLNFTSRNGRNRLYINKILSMGIFCFLIVLTEIVTVLIVASFSHTPIPWTQPIQQSSYAKWSPYSVNFLQYTLLLIGMKTFGFFAFTVIVSFIASFFKRIWGALLITSSLAVGRVFLYLYLTGRTTVRIIINDFTEFLKKFILNFSTFVYGCQPLRFVNEINRVTIGNVPVASWLSSLLVSVICIALFGALGSIVYSRRTDI